MPRQSEQTLQRIRFVDHLANCGMEVPVFIPSLSGKQIELFKLDSDSYMAFSWQKIEGEVMADLAPRDLNTFYRQWAELLANTHKCSRSFGLDAFPSWQDEWQSCHDALPDEELKSVFFQVKADLEMRSRSSLNFACIHNDAHPLNIVQSSRILIVPAGIFLPRTLQTLYIANILALHFILNIRLMQDPCAVFL
jgi:Ser/Thr protein kinase RdoA (MazF antagonist)